MIPSSTSVPGHQEPQHVNSDVGQDNSRKEKTHIFWLIVMAILWVVDFLLFWVLDHWWQSLLIAVPTALLVCLLPWWKVGIVALAILAVYLSAKQRQGGKK